MEQVYWAAPKGMPQYLPAEMKRKNFRYTMSRPWTEEFRRANAPGLHRKKVYVEPIKDWSFFPGDLVEVLVGKDKGKIGTVTTIIEERNWVIVDGLNTHYRRVGKMADYPGVVVQSEAPLLVTNEVALVDPTDRKGTEIEWRYSEQGEKVRVSKRSGHIIPIPAAADETIDYKVRMGYPEQPKDTLTADVTDITYQPALKTFEMDLMEYYQIKK
nr:EOG090X0ADH [Sida crystallina]